MTEAEQTGLVNGFLSFEGEVLKIEPSLECANPHTLPRSCRPSPQTRVSTKNQCISHFLFESEDVFLKQAVDGNTED